jgi:DNA-directed RNA polymerase
MDDMTERNLYEVQRLLEQESVELGIKRYRAALAGGLDSVQPGVALLKRSIPPVVKLIEEFVASAEAGRAGKNASVAYFLAQYDADVVAYMAIRRTLASLSKRTPLTRLAVSIGSYLEDALNFDKLRAEAPGLYKQLQRRIATRKDYGVRHFVMRRQAKYAGIKTVQWDQTSKIKVGLKLIDFIATGANLVKSVLIFSGAKDRTNYVVPTEATLAWLEQAHESNELMAPMHLPMVVQPKEWTTPFNGGYLEQRSTLLKVRNQEYLKELAVADMPALYPALNALQSTRWRINGGVLSALKQVRDAGQTLGGLPSRDSLPLPVSPQADFEVPKEARTEEQTARIKAWKGEANKVYAENMRLESKRVALAQRLWVAEKFSEFEAIYFPHALDWRGRAYPIPATLSPQSDDVSKALLEFADGCKLGDNGAYWLAVHGANCFGVDKVAFEQRVQWVEENTDAIREVAFDPIRNRMWIEADAPWQFLAFAKEWAGLQMHVAAGGAQGDFVSHLPVGLDGSCNGLQNFSAMLRDEVGGAATNLVPSEKPSDIYAEVAKVSQKIVEFDAGSGNERAMQWIGKIDRKITKRNAMTYAYAATQFGFTDQLLAEMKKHADEHDGVALVDGDQFKAAVYLAGVNYQAIGQVVVAARQAMKWLIEAARVAATDGLPIRWSTPVGLLVQQNYRVIVGERIKGDIAGERVRLTYSVESDQLDKRKQAQGIAPNFVHSMDAAHLMATINACAGQGITSFAMVHDSYGTHAGNIDVLAYELRRAFVDQYSKDVLGTFREQLAAQLPPELAAKIPPLPPTGKLDLEAIMDSEYFFA